MLFKKYSRRIDLVITSDNIIYRDRKNHNRLYNKCGMYALCGFTSNIYSDNLSEICDEFIKRIRKHDPDNVVDLMKLTALKFK